MFLWWMLIVDNHLFSELLGVSTHPTNPNSRVKHSELDSRRPRQSNSLDRSPSNKSTGHDSRKCQVRNSLVPLKNPNPICPTDQPQICWFPLASPQRTATDDVLSVYSMSPRQIRVPRLEALSKASPQMTSRRDYDLALSKATRLFPANLPMIVTESSATLHDLDRGVNHLLNCGEIVNALYKNGSWISVKTCDEAVGFVPAQSLKPFRRTPPRIAPGLNDRSSVSSQSGKHWYDQASDDGHAVFNYGVDSCFSDITFCSSCADSQSMCSSDFDSPAESDDGPCFHKERILTVLYNYRAAHFDDVSVCQHEVVTSSDSEPVNWIWICRANGEQGYVPREYVADLPRYQISPNIQTTDLW